VLAPDRATTLAPDWSPDGQRIAFHSFRDLNAELYVMNADGTGLQRLTHSWALDAGARWSPDGTRLAFLSDAAADELINDSVIDLSVIDMATGAITPATEGLGDVRWHDWDPTGNRICFIRGGMNGLGELWVVDLDTGEMELLFGGPVGLPSWSPDGKTIAIEIGYGVGGRQVAVLDLATGTLDTIGPGVYPSWSGDGTRLYATIDGETLVAYDLATGMATEVGPMPYGVASPDGEWIVFSADPNGARS
jgi:Tol biopolymer transport system component